VDILDFFDKNVLPDLNAPVSGAIHPILKVDAIKYLYTFRSQFSKQQLVAALPLLVRHLESTNFAVYTYSAICIERILFMRVSGSTGPMMYVVLGLLYFVVIQELDTMELTFLILILLVGSLLMILHLYRRT